VADNNVITDCSVSVTRAFRADGTSYPVYWELRNSAMGEQLIDAVSEAGEFVDPTDTSEVWDRKNVAAVLRDKGCNQLDAVRMTLWLVEHDLILS
jgi:hypothetical protein